MSRIEQIWQELESDTSFQRGVLLRRYAGTVLPDVYIALRAPERLRAIAASIRNDVRIPSDVLNDLRDIGVEVLPDDSNQERNLLVIALLNTQHGDTFPVLCEDLISSVSSITAEKQLVKELLNRLAKWQSLFDKAAATGLSAEEQRGLYGELFFLRKLLDHHTANWYECIHTWHGPEHEVKDFQHGTWAVEVKTTHGNNHQNVRISSERQLDATGLDLLWLYHLSLQSLHDSGETLNDAVESLLTLLAPDFRSLALFRSRLAEGGYFDHHRPLYAEMGYAIRAATCYEVRDDFPRIEERDIRDGVGDVQYSIILSQAGAYVRDEQDVLNEITFA